MAKKSGKTAGCEYCSNYIYDEDLGYYVCDVNLDEDEMSRFLSDIFYNCPYFQMEDEYKIVRKQMQKALRLAGKETIMEQQMTYGLSKG